MNNIFKKVASIIIFGAFLLLAYASEDSKNEKSSQTESKNENENENENQATSQTRFAVENFKPGRMFEFHEQSIVNECKDPTIRKISVVDEKSAKIYVWHKGCPNDRIEEDELIYNYRIDDASNWRHEYVWLKTDNKVIILENESTEFLQVELIYIYCNGSNSGRS
jgi:hypothetical protein